MALSIRQIRWLALYVVSAGAAVGLYLLAAANLGETGFPLDDAWIHQTYARSLAQTGRWEYVPGQVSAGSTAPLWTILLAAGYLLHIPYQLWTWGLGVVLLALIGRLSHLLAKQLFPERNWVGPAMGLACVAEWHLIWAAASGMETPLFVVLMLALLLLAQRFTQDRGGQPLRTLDLANGAAFGALAALLVLCRPEGAILLGLLGLCLGWLVLTGRWNWRDGFKWALAALVPFALLLIPYLAFNLRHSGGLWPNTFYAKQTEYAAVLTRPLLSRLIAMCLPPFTGFQVLLVPGLIWYVTRYGRKGPVYWVMLAYPLLQILIYALRLPVTYQHGRYLIPSIPFLLICGLGGLQSWWRPKHPAAWRRILSRAWLGALSLLTLAFVGVGAQAFAKDVQIIQSEMVVVAKWLQSNTESTDWVAAHDIGAIGFFAQRPILDLAGLISPQVVSLMVDERLLADYILGSEARYLVTAPGWPYAQLTTRPEVALLFSADSPWTAAEGMNSSSIYDLSAVR